LGAACVREFSGAGANVVIADIGEHGAQLASELGTHVRFARTDVTDEVQVSAAVALALAQFGALHPPSARSEKTGRSRWRTSAK
jgi:NAD(P)-dependent dehydrogenase (short-subunit alcohol dehydrogenase family)